MKKVFILSEKHPTKDVNIYNYTHIRVYHASRPIKIENYLEDGIHDFSKEEAYELVKNTLLQCNIGEKEIKVAFDKAWENGIHHFNTVCVGISQKELMNKSGHYLVYGSEFICGIAVQLYCQRELKKIGVPTIFICDVAIDKIPSETLACIENGWFYDGKWDGGIYIRGNIEPFEIVDYVQPIEMFDPIEWKKYIYR